MLKIIFMGTSDFAVPALEALSARHEVVAVFTQKGTDSVSSMNGETAVIYDKAKSYGYEVYTPRSLKMNYDLVRNMSADIIVVVSYGLIIPYQILDLPRHGGINIHPSSLPKFRGAAPIQRAIMAGDDTIDVCIIEMDKGIDTGPILSRRSLDIKDKYYEEVRDVAANIGAEMLLEVLDNIEMIKRIEQSDDGACYAAKLRKEDGRINWQESAYKIYCMTHGLNPWPGVFFIYQDTIIKIIRAIYEDVHHEYPPGFILDGGKKIACGQGCLSLIEVQRAGRKAIGITEFLRGFPMRDGDILV